MKPGTGLFVVLLNVALVSWSAHAAGGHHAVDDAALLDAGKCKLESWVERETGGARALLHGGAGCRVGAVELGLSLDREKQADADSTTSFGPQVKWAYAVNDALSVGAALSLKFNSGSPRYAGSSLVLPLTWRLTDAVSAHFNWGRSFLRGGASQPKAGASLEWSPVSDLSLVAERFREADSNATRVGARYALTPSVKLDISRARTLNADGSSWWTAGLTWEFDR